MNELKLYFEGHDYCSVFFRNYVKHKEVNFEDCDFVISSSFESGNSIKKEIQEKLDTYINYDKKVIVFLLSDYNNKLNVPSNVILFRTSLYKSIKKDNEFILPYLWDYFTDEIQIIEKSDKPIVGFCGNIKKNSGHRLSCINKLKANKNIQSNFITRLGFAGGVAELVPAFKKNILDSHFTISNRGRGNFSIRFYQVMSLARIPVLIDTDMVFPFEDEIDWKTLIITAKNETKLVKKINNYWKFISNEKLIENQKKCKEIFDTYLSPNGFGNKMTEFLIDKKQNPITIKPKYFDFLKFPHLKYKFKRYFYVFKIKLLKQ